MKHLPRKGELNSTDSRAQYMEHTWRVRTRIFTVSSYTMARCFVCEYTWAPFKRSYHELVNGPLDGLNETGQFLVLIGCDASGDDRPGDTASPTEGSLGSHKDVRNVLYTHLNMKIRRTWSNTYLLFAQQRKMQQNLKRFSIRSENDNLSDTTVECLRSWGGTVSLN